MTRSTDITSFSDYRQRMREHNDRVKRSGRPLFITRDGEPDAVVLSPQAYDELADRADLPEIMEKIREGLKQSENGEVVEARKALRDIAREFGIRSK